ncbi:MAG: SDR family NAD(P)-dependent oxidoreductase [Pirellulales bacterium]
MNDRASLAGQSAVVTGASTGIGRAIAIELAQAGANVLVHARTRRDKALEVASRIRNAGVEVDVVLADLTEVEACRTLAERAFAWSDIDIWINNAGADVLTGDAVDWSFERKLERLWRVDVVATMQLSRNVGQRMRSRGCGVIVNMGWDQAETGMEGDSGEMFAAAKGAVMAFSRSLAKSLAPEVRVNCLAPGWIRTAWGEQTSEVWQRRAREECLLGRWGTPEDVARVCRFLVSPDARFVTGEVLHVNGGRGGERGA